MPVGRSGVAREALRAMRVVFWNVAVGGDRRLGLLERLDADVLLLAEVSPASARS